MLPRHRPVRVQYSRRSRFDLMKNLLLLTLPSVFVCIIAGELFFRFVIPACEHPWKYYDPVDKIAKLQTDQGSGVYTIGKFAQQRGKWRVNNAGWNSAVDYFEPSQRKKPLIAIIGDSYIEALQVDVDDSIVSVLRQKVQSQYDVYGFGISGAPLSEYLQMSRYVVKHFDPEVIVINVVQYDLEESVLSGTSYPYFLGIDMTNGKPKESILASHPVAAKQTTKLVFKSAIFSYLWHNLKLGEVWTQFWAKRHVNEKSPTSKEDTILDAKSKIYEAADYVLRKMREENPMKSFVLLVDAPRRDIYNRVAPSSDLLWMHKVLTDLATRHQFGLVDLTEPFQDRYAKEMVKFNSEYDYHWNKHGHQSAGEVLHRKLMQLGRVRAVQ